jgi:hypothetical protein
LRVASKDPAVTGGRDGKHRVVAVQVHIANLRTDVVTLSFDVPKRTRELVVEPSARFPAIHWQSGTHKWDDTEARRVKL